VKYPEPNGISWDAFLQLAHALEEGKLSGMDCTEIRPIAGDMATEFLAVKTMFKLLATKRA
jgi:arginase family enzyme